MYWAHKEPRASFMISQGVDINCRITSSSLKRKIVSLFVISIPVLWLIVRHVELSDIRNRFKKTYVQHTHPLVASRSIDRRNCSFLSKKKHVSLFITSIPVLWLIVWNVEPNDDRNWFLKKCVCSTHIHQLHLDQLANLSDALFYDLVMSFSPTIL